MQFEKNLKKLIFAYFIKNDYFVQLYKIYLKK